VHEKTPKHTPICTYFKYFSSVLLKITDNNKKAPQLRGHSELN